jgi:hypothetical protein
MLWNCIKKKKYRAVFLTLTLDRDEWSTSCPDASSHGREQKVRRRLGRSKSQCEHCGADILLLLLTGTVIPLLFSLQPITYQLSHHSSH